MKRSEFIRTLDERLRGTLSFHNDPNFAEQLLSLFEDLGMAPPGFTDLPNSYDRANGTYGYWTNAWEDENETT